MCSSGPIYDSISKEGYSSAYSCDTLQKAQQAGIIDSKVMALGGITLEHLPEIAALGFGGAVLLGDVWQQAKEAFMPPLPPPETAFLSPL